MERLDESGSGTITEKESLQERKVSHNTHHELSNILSEVQMMSDSLAACSRMSKHRTFRKAVKINDRVSTQFLPTPQSSMQILLPTEDSILNGNHSDEGENIISSFIMKINQTKKKPYRNTSVSQEELASESDSDEQLTENLEDKFGRRRESLYTDTGKGREYRKGSTTVRMYKPGSVVPERMIDVIQREIKTLMKLSPSLAYLLVTMSDTMLHYKSCFKCMNNIHHTFPWILSKLQKLIKYIINKRQGIYIWPNDYSYLRLVPDEQTASEREDFQCENTESLPDWKSDSPTEEQEVQLGKLEKVDPLVVSGSYPGVQLSFQVKSRQTRKRFFRRVSKKFRDDSCGKFPVVQLTEISEIPIYLILRHHPVFEVHLSEKRAVSTPKLISCRSLLKFKFPSLTQEFFFSAITWGRIRKVKKKKKKEVVVLRQLQFTDQSAKAKVKSNDRISYFTKNILINFSELVFDLLTEGEEEKMQMQKVRELETEVKELRSLMLDVRRNQAELTKVFHQKHISSLPLLKFASPEMLQEEDWVVNQISEIKLHKTRTSSLEALQSTLGDLKRKCNLKNRLIMTMLKGFESNVPKEWWNEIMSLLFGDSLEDTLSAEKVGGSIRKTSYFLRNGEQASSTLLPLTRLDEKPSKEKAGDSGLKIPSASEPSRQSSHPLVNGIKEPLVFKRLSSHSSSFIQNVLFEDSCTGVAVIDLFIALKSIKENLELLSESNEKISKRMNFLNEETEIVWKEFIELVESMRIFLEKMNADISTYNLEKLGDKFSTPSFNKSNEKMEKVDCKSKFACEECGRDIKEIYSNENKKFTCLGCLISALKEKSLSQLPISPEAFLGSFLASILYWQRGPEKEGNSSTVTNSSSLIFEKIASNGNLNIRESTVQMICDICEVLNMSGAREKEKLPPTQPLIHPGIGPGGLSLKTPEGTKHETGRSGPTPGEPKQKSLRFESGQSSRDVVENRGELTSEGDSEFEEALTCQLNHPHDSRAKPSVTCMGDLSKAPSGKKSVSTLTPNNNFMTSWVGKLSDEIKSKVKQRKSKRAKKRVKVLERKSELEPEKIPEMVQFSIAANPSAGVFDVTVVQYKNHRYLAKYPMKYKKVQPGLVANSTPDPHFPILIKKSIDEFLSEESVVCSASESMETCSNFGEDDMGEFLEIYVEDKKKSNIQDSFPVPSSKCHLYGNLKNMELKIGKTHYIEMHRLYPVFFVQEFVRKARKPEQNVNSERENLSNDSSEERIFSLNSEEKQEEKIVIEGDSSDLVIYIQLEIEDDSGSVPSRLVLDYEKSALEIQTKENDSGLSASCSEKTIRLSNDVPKGESLFKVWRAEEANRISEVNDTEKTVSEKPLVVIEKKEEKEEVEEEESSKDLEKNMSDKSIEREVKDKVPEEAKVVDRANVLVIKNIKQSATIWHHQIPKHWKTETIRLKKLEVSKDIMESIKSSAGELRKALLLIHEIESDIVDAQIDSAISILPRLELELRRHLNTKIKGLETKETKNRISVDNFFSSFDFGQREDSIGGESDESSEYRFNNLLKLLSNLEDAVKSSEHSNNKIELCYNESSKIYQLLHALTDSIRELEEGLNVTSLSQTLNFASRLHTAIKEYDSIVKKQPADYLTPQEKSRKKRKPRWNTTEEASVTQHLKNVRKKVFEMVEMEAVGMEERIERDFDRLDRLGSENDEALMFLETLLQKTQKRVSEFKSLKTELKDMNSSLNNFYENFQKEMTDTAEEKMEAKVLESSLEGSLERIIEKSLDRNSESSQEKVSVRSSGKISNGTTLNRVSEKNIEIFPEKPSQEIPEQISEKNLKKDLESTTEKTSNENSEKVGVSVIEKNSERSLGTISKRTPSGVSERRLEKTTAKTSVRIQGRVPGNSVERTIDKNSERNSSTSSKATANRVIERTAEKNSRKSLNKTSGKISNKSVKQNVETSLETNSGRHMEKFFKGSLEALPTFPPLEEDQEKTGDKVSINSSERNEKRFLKKASDGCLNKISESLRISEKLLENALTQPSGKISGENVGRISEKSSHEALIEPTENSRKTPDMVHEGLAPPKNTEGEPITQESLEQIVSSFINAIDYLKLKSTTENKAEDKPSEEPSTQSLEKAQKLENSTAPDPLTSTIKEFKVIGQSSLYLSWTEPEGPLEGSINGYEIYVDGKLNQKVRNPQRLQAVLYSVDLSKKIQVQLYAVVENNPKALLASMHLNGE